ncbi:MAG: signal peptidase II [bacterium]
MAVGKDLRARSRAPMLGMAGVTLAADQISKALAVAALGEGERADVLGRFFGFRLVRNSGGVFGILQESPIFFLLASVAIVAALIAWAWRSGVSSPALGLVLGGGLGNIVDRLVRPPGPLRGSVVDFVDFSFWPTFNVADSAIVVGVGLLVFSALRPARP